MEYYVYTDGSFKSVPGIGGCYSSAALLLCPETGNTATFCKVDDNPELLPLRNVAGEILAVMMVLEHCLNVLHVTQEDTITIYHDYVGVANWVKQKGDPDYWRCKNQWTQAYRNYINNIVRPRCKLKFEHVAGHTGNAGNEKVDQMARDAVENELLKRLEHRK